jgi:uroporphyrinogen-III decarboxylase
MAGFNEDIESMGFPPFGGRGGVAPGGPAFDVMANTYRGWKGIIKDMFRQPDKLIAAMEKINDMSIARAKPADKSTPGLKLGGGGALHRGSDRFLSKKQWETFYWPTWKKSMDKAIELGYTPFIFAEGFCEERFEYFLEFPKGSVVIRFTDTNMFKAKEALGDHFCLMGSVPLTMLQIASPSEVEEYCKKLIQVCGKGGGYILRTDTDYIQDANPKNVRVMVESVEKYGRY